MIGLLQGRRVPSAWLAAGALTLAAIAAVGVILSGGDTTGRAPEDERAAAASSQPLAMHEAPRPLRAIAFEDGNGRALTLDAFKGRTILLNVWATWCGPCREEMPTLDALQASLGGPLFEVVALSVDRAGPEVVRAFYAETGVRHLGLYIDSSMRASFGLGTVGLPTTLLIDAEGRELGRLSGPATWDTPDVIAFLQTHLAAH